MIDTPWKALRDLLVEKYDELKVRLASRVGSIDLASESLHETYLRLNRTDNMEPVLNPYAYLFRMALNVARDRERANTRRLALSEVEALLSLDDGTFDPALIAQGYADINELSLAINELSPRQREIFIAARLEETPHREIGVRFGISSRTVERELKSALAQLEKKINKKFSKRFASGPSQSS
jgi:RNA polymerase sigma factor (sigma-70 family)